MNNPCGSHLHGRPPPRPGAVVGCRLRQLQGA